MTLQIIKGFMQIHLLKPNHCSIAGSWQQEEALVSMCFNHGGVISSLNSKPQRLVDQVTYSGGSISSTESDVDKLIGKA